MVNQAMIKQEDRGSRYEEKRYFERRYSDDAKLAEPNINVVLRGLPDEATEADIARQLNKMSASIEEVSLIKSRDTGESRKFAFVRFTSVGHAMQFVERHRVFHMRDYRVRVDYSHKNSGSAEKEEWRCSNCGKYNDTYRRVCIECKQSNIRDSKETRTFVTDTLETDDGQDDASETPSALLLLRDLDHLSTEESIYKAISPYQGVYRVLLIRDKLTKLSCSFAFVEFVDVQCAMTALEYIHYYGLTVDQQALTVVYGDVNSFIPVYGQAEFAIPANTMEGFQAYRGSTSFASQYSPILEQDRKRQEEARQKAQQDEREKQEKYKASLQNDLSAFFADMHDFDSADKHSDIFSVPKTSHESH
ncbi:hypothetical protein BY458DRAFT_558365 [Sporodiniella umbellata]|nr:hypothetical protein BY458DRAFT_558365 [Sporodiniella umbellata]